MKASTEQSFFSGRSGLLFDLAFEVGGDIKTNNTPHNLRYKKLSMTIFIVQVLYACTNVRFSYERRKIATQIHYCSLQFLI